MCRILTIRSTASPEYLTATDYERFIYLSIYLFIYTHLSCYLFTSIYLSIHLSINMLIYLKPKQVDGFSGVPSRD